MLRSAVLGLFIVLLSWSSAQLPADVKCGSFLDEPQMIRQANFAVPTEHQWLGRIVYSNDKVNLPTNACLGVLVSRRSLLAPAHCFVQYNGNPKAYSVQLGVWNKTGNALELSCLQGYCVIPAQEIVLSEIAIHPGYDPLTLRNTLAVLTLEKPIEESPNIMPVCMPPLSLLNDTLIGQLFFVAGFPVTKDLKNKTWVKTISRSWCQSKHQNLVISSSTVCGYLQRVERYHLGAPLVGVHVENDEPKYLYLVGLQLEAVNADNRIAASFLEIRPYLEYINNNVIWS